MTAPYRRILPALLLLALVTACQPGKMIEKLADAEKVKIARTYIQRVSDGEFTELAAELDPSLKNGGEVGQLKAMGAVLPHGNPTVTNVVGYSARHFPKETSYNVTFQFCYGTKWFLVNAAWREKAGVPREILGLRVVPLAKSLEEANAISFANAGAVHYLMLLGAIVVPVFSIVTLVVCIRTRIAKKKWLWILAILFGVTRVAINWSTGTTEFMPLYISLFGASAVADSMYSPWILSVSIPAGAILFWLTRSQLGPKSGPVEMVPSELPRT